MDSGSVFDLKKKKAVSAKDAKIKQKKNKKIKVEI